MAMEISELVDVLLVLETDVVIVDIVRYSIITGDENEENTPRGKIDPYYR